MVSAIHRRVHLGESVRQAVAYVNGHDATATHALTRSTLDRVFHTLPPHLLHPATCTEAALVDFIHDQQCETRTVPGGGTSLLTVLEEGLLVDYIQFRHSSNTSIGAEVIKAAAIRLLAKRKPPVQPTSTLSSHTVVDRDEAEE